LTSKIGYVPSDYLDPALRTKWNILEGMALERNDIESIEDLIMPDFDAIDNVSLILFILIRSEYDLGYVKLCASTETWPKIRDIQRPCFPSRLPVSVYTLNFKSEKPST
jgi:hypothetical protein